ncbi:uncharacterized protein LOC130663355 isoform X1 [Microplitis mediator]|uniref:uncharacterized protein LOC130663355 isoform X1 n=2 Tax=Microplitis mediator TaxID=375433 RepID=UPI002557A3BC|nr:uncharacterized protein LOC130663355 isoform X1 [Microplitis mediator]
MDLSKKTVMNSTSLSNSSDYAGATNYLFSSTQNCSRLEFNQEDTTDDVINKLKYLLNAINEVSAENKILERESNKVLGSLDLEPQSLSRDVNTGLNKITAILRKENLTEINENTLLINMERRKLDELKKAREDRDLKKKYEELCNKYANIQDKFHYIQENVNSLNEFIIAKSKDSENDYTNLIHKSTKLNDYNETFNNLEQELAVMKVTDDYPNKILEKHKEYMQSAGELATINKSLSQYGDLPPDILQARAVIEQLEKRRQETKRLLEEKMHQ